MEGGDGPPDQERIEWVVEMTYHSDQKHHVFFSRSNAARDAVRRGLPSFETMPIPNAPDGWTYEIRREGPGIEYARDFAQDKDWIAWVELTDLEIPVLIVTCFKDEIGEDVPDLFELRPITPELWEKRDETARRRGRVEFPRILPRGETGSDGAQDASDDPSPTIPQPETKARPAPSPARKDPSAPRAKGAKDIVREVYLSMPGASKKDVVEECVNRGIFRGTAAARYTDIFREQNSQ